MGQGSLMNELQNTMEKVTCMKEEETFEEKRYI